MGLRVLTGRVPRPARSRRGLGFCSNVFCHYLVSLTPFGPAVTWTPRYQLCRPLSRDMPTRCVLTSGVFLPPLGSYCLLGHVPHAVELQAASPSLPIRGPQGRRDQRAVLSGGKLAGVCVARQNCSTLDS